MRSLSVRVHVFACVRDSHNTKERHKNEGASASTNKNNIQCTHAPGEPGEKSTASILGNNYRSIRSRRVAIVSIVAAAAAALTYLALVKGLVYGLGHVVLEFVVVGPVVAFLHTGRGARRRLRLR